MPTWDPVPPAPAGPLSQVLVLVTVALALVLTTSVADAAHVGAWSALVLGLSVAVGSVTRADRAFRSFPGLVAALVVFMVLLLSAALLRVQLPPGAGLALILVPLVPVGLDWRRVGRLQAVTAVAALLLVPVASADRPGAMATALGWFVLATASLWCLEQDRRRGEDRAQPLVPGRADDDSHPDDLLRTLVPAVAVGLLAALLLSVPSCNLGMPDVGEPRPVELQPGEPGSGDPSIGPGSGEPGGEPGPGVTGPGYGPSPGPGAEEPPAAEEPSDGPRFSPWWLLAVVAVAAAIAYLWWRRSREVPTATPDREWALALVAQIDDAGRARGSPRRGARTVLQHTDALASSVLPDQRLRDVGRLLNDALFGRTPITAATRLWAQSVVDDVIDANPVERRARR